jgi:hypothetical protein
MRNNPTPPGVSLEVSLSLNYLHTLWNSSFWAKLLPPSLSQGDLGRLLALSHLCSLGSALNKRIDIYRMTHLEQRARFSVLREFHIPSILGLKILG